MGCVRSLSEAPMRSPLIICICALLLAEGVAGALAHHQILSQAPIKKKGKIVGFRATVLLDPEGSTSEHAKLGGDARLALGGLKFSGDRTNDDLHRGAVAGVEQGYVLHQFKMREITGPKTKGPLVETLKTGGQAREVEVEVLYKDNPKIVPGTEADLVAGFWRGSYWHVWGAADSPTQSSREFVVKLPGSASRTFIRQQMKTLTAQLGQAKADAAAVQQKFDVAQKAETAAKLALDEVNQKLQPALIATTQARTAADTAYRQAIQGPRAAYDQATQAANTAYRNAADGASNTYNQLCAAERAKLSAAPSGDASARNAYDQAVRTAWATYSAALQNASKQHQQAFDQAQAALTQATAAPLATMQQAIKAAQADYDQKAQKLNYTAVYQRFNAARTALGDATGVKTVADAKLKDLDDRIAGYQAMLPKPRAPRPSSLPTR